MIANIIFYVICVFLLVYLCFFKRSEITEHYDVSKIDVTLSDVNNFIRRETLYSFASWFNAKITTKNMSNPNQASSLITELKAPDIIKKKLETISAYIFITMSPALKSQFYAVYNKSAYTDPDEILNVYISRHVMFYIRKVNVDITALFQENKNQTTDELLKMYVVSLENEIYKNNDIAIIKANETDGTKSVE